MKDLEKAYNPKDFEDAIYKKWEASGFFNPDACIKEGVSSEDADPYSIVLPPPNVTGTLHIGHAMMLAIEDLMIRYHRMKGDKTLWAPGTDHAAIATQNKVEKILFENEKKTRHDLGREKFLKKVWEYVGKSQETIHKQMRKMGSSLDWSREAFTLDEQREKAVRTVFTKMYDDGLIERGHRIVNWCTRCQSTLADDEVEYKERQGKFYYLKYGPVVIGTARPETKFADKVIVVHPDDKRYKDMHGKKLTVPWITGDIEATFVADEVADPELGSGAMTITPAHSFVDFELAQKHGFEIKQIIDTDGKLTDVAGDLAGTGVKEARKKVVEILDKKGLLDSVDENYIHNLSVCYRCGTAVEPLVSSQWFVLVNKKFKSKSGKKTTLKMLMQDAVRSGDVRIIPERFEKTYFHWIDNLRDWCISRQIWFGHQIPVWKKDEEMYVGVDAPKGDCWEQDPDTLDTWFSSGLWTFSPLGWPDSEKDLKRFHPTSVLETGYDILFFWVARMILMSTYVLGEVPFKDVYLHGLVRDEKGRKMSKSLDNTIDPLVVSAEYGTDAVRLSLVLGQTPGNDSRLSDKKIAGFRNFTNKLWNIGRYILSQEGEEAHLNAETVPEKWIVSRLHMVTKKVGEDIDDYAFSRAGERLRDFTWNELADWYVEISKVQPNPGLLKGILDVLIRLWHPFMPFVTEALFDKSKSEGDREFLMISKWPDAEEISYDPQAIELFDHIKGVISSIRSTRALLNVPAAKKIDCAVAANNPPWEIIDYHSDIIKRLARLESLTRTTDAPKQSATVALRHAAFYLQLDGVIDISAEKKRLQKEQKQLAQFVERLEKKLANEKFVANAQHELVEAERLKLADTQQKIVTIETQLKNL